MKNEWVFICEYQRILYEWAKYVLTQNLEDVTCEFQSKERVVEGRAHVEDHKRNRIYTAAIYIYIVVYISNQSGSLMIGALIELTS